MTISIRKVSYELIFSCEFLNFNVLDKIKNYSKFISNFVIVRHSATKFVHWHILLSVSGNVSLEDISRWFGIDNHHIIKETSFVVCAKYLLQSASNEDFVFSSLSDFELKTILK